MKPIDTFPDESARALLGVCFDVDDTVTTDGVLDPRAYEALFRLRDAGLTRVAVTGRPLGFAEFVARTWPVDAAVGENGAGYLARRPGGLESGYWDPLETRVRQQETLVRIRERVARELPHVAVSSDAWARRCDLAFDVGEHVSLPRADVDRLLALLAEEGANTSVSSIHAHAQLGDHDKARGVKHALSALLGLDEQSVRERFLFVGDSGNDAAAFAWFRLTAGVANVRAHLDRLPVPPVYVARARSGAGFAEIVETVLARRGVTR